MFNGFTLSCEAINFIFTSMVYLLVLLFFNSFILQSTYKIHRFNTFLTAEVFCLGIFASLVAILSIFKHLTKIELRIISTLELYTTGVNRHNRSFFEQMMSMSLAVLSFAINLFIGYFLISTMAIPRITAVPCTATQRILINNTNDYTALHIQIIDNTWACMLVAPATAADPYTQPAQWKKVLASAEYDGTSTIPEVPGYVTSTNNDNSVTIKLDLHDTQYYIRYGVLFNGLYLINPSGDVTDVPLNDAPNHFIADHTGIRTLDDALMPEICN